MSDFCHSFLDKQFFSTIIMEQFEDTDFVRSCTQNPEISCASALNGLTEQALLLCGHMSCLLVSHYHQVQFIHFSVSARDGNFQEC